MAAVEAEAAAVVDSTAGAITEVVGLPFVLSGWVSGDRLEIL